METENEVCADPLDTAANKTLLETESRLQTLRAKTKAAQVKNPDGTWPQPDCVICGDEIPTARLEATGTDTCIFCKERMERNDNTYR